MAWSWKFLPMSLCALRSCLSIPDRSALRVQMQCLLLSNMVTRCTGCVYAISFIGHISAAFFGFIIFWPYFGAFNFAHFLIEAHFGNGNWSSFLNASYAVWLYPPQRFWSSKTSSRLNLAFIFENIWVLYLFQITTHHAIMRQIKYSNALCFDILMRAKFLSHVSWLRKSIF